MQILYKNVIFGQKSVLLAHFCRPGSRIRFWQIFKDFLLAIGAALYFCKILFFSAKSGFSEKRLSVSQLFLTFSPLIKVVTGHCKNGGIRAGGYFGGHL